MSGRTKGLLFACAAGAALITTTTAQSAVPYAHANTPAAVDGGELAAEAAPLSVTVALSAPKSAEAESLLQAINTKGDPAYHQFLTAEQYAARFAPPAAEVSKVIASLAKYGLSAEQSTATTLRVTGSAASIERAFAVSLHSFSVPAHGEYGSYSYHAPLGRATIPAELSGSVAGVLGLDSRPAMRPMHLVAPANLSQRPGAHSAATTNPFGQLTVTDFASLYDVKPLYAHGIDGKGRTIGILTFASFTPADAFAYWKAVGLKVDAKRLKVINVDGGPGVPSDVSGSDETTLDVEQSGGVATAAKIEVYQAPNTNQGFVDVLAAAVESNKAESLSMSWGGWEHWDDPVDGAATDPLTGRPSDILRIFHELLVRAALQGQSVYTSSGDGGAYTLNDSLQCFGPYSASDPTSCRVTLSADYPASDPAITAAGGTTLPGEQSYCLDTACKSPLLIDVPHERVWGWDYLAPLCAATGTPTPLECGTFPVGGGGGVSIEFEKPWYQQFLPGTQRSQPDQVYQIGSKLAAEVGIKQTYYVLPAYYAGRNVPDVSFNADPQTGYVVYYTSEPSGKFVLLQYGGTSFVAPQLNGVTALLGESLHGRIGLINYPLYASAALSKYLPESHKIVRPIAYGDNWFYHGTDGYNPGAGLGTLDVANFAKFLSGEFY